MTLITSPLLQNQVVLITGASRGIGAATAKLLAAHGAAVAVNYNHSKEQAEQVVQDIKNANGNAIAVKATVNDAEQVEAMVKTVEETLGPIDTLVMNAVAVRRYVFGPFMQIDWEDFQDMVLGELAGIYFPAKAVIPRMIERKRGNMIAVSSMISRSPEAGGTAHAAGKSGVDGMVKALVRELGPHGIRVNIVSPGVVDTQVNEHMPPEFKQSFVDKTPLGRIAQPEDIAGAIMLLATNEARYLTGTYVTANGGIFMV